MKIVNTQPTKTAEIHKETFYCRFKSDIKPHLKKLGYNLTYDFTLLKTSLNNNKNF